MLIKNPRYVLTSDGIVQDKNVVIEDDKIKSLGGSDKRGKVIDASNHAVLPGFINMHKHSSMNLLRGVSDDKKLQEWLQEDIWPLEEKLDGDMCYWGAMHAFIEMIKTGTTCFNDMYFSMDRVADAAEDIGIRGHLGYAMIDVEGKEKREREIKEAKRTLKTIESGYSDLVKPAIAPHSLETCSEELLRWSKEFSEKNNVPVHMHVAETKNEVEKSIEEYNMRPVEKLEEIGLLNERFAGAHAIHLSDGEIEKLSNRSASVIYNPCSNMKLASGVSNVSKMSERGVNVCLGTDSATSNNNLDMFEEMKIGALLQKVHNSDPTVMPAKEMLKLPTKNAAKALNINAGAIEEGRLADLMLVDLEHLKMKPTHNLISNLIYSGGTVDTNIINGKIVMENGKMKTIDEKKVLSKADEIASEITS